MSFLSRKAELFCI